MYPEEVSRCETRTELSRVRSRIVCLEDSSVEATAVPKSVSSFATLFTVFPCKLIIRKDVAFSTLGAFISPSLSPYKLPHMITTRKTDCERGSCHGAFVNFAINYQHPKIARNFHLPKRSMGTSQLRWPQPLRMHTTANVHSTVHSSSALYTPILTDMAPRPKYASSWAVKLREANISAYLPLLMSSDETPICENASRGSARVRTGRRTEV